MGDKVQDEILAWPAGQPRLDDGDDLSGEARLPGARIATLQMCLAAQYSPNHGSRLIERRGGKIGFLERSARNLVSRPGLFRFRRYRRASREGGASFDVLLTKFGYCNDLGSRCACSGWHVARGNQPSPPPRLRPDPLRRHINPMPAKTLSEAHAPPDPSLPPLYVTGPETQHCISSMLTPSGAAT